MDQDEKHSVEELVRLKQELKQEYTRWEYKVGVRQQTTEWADLPIGLVQRKPIVIEDYEDVRKYLYILTRINFYRERLPDDQEIESDYNELLNLLHQFYVNDQDRIVDKDIVFACYRISEFSKRKNVDNWYIHFRDLLLMLLNFVQVITRETIDEISDRLRIVISAYLPFDYQGYPDSLFMITYLINDNIREIRGLTASILRGRQPYPHYARYELQTNIKKNIEILVNAPITLKQSTIDQINHRIDEIVLDPEFEEASQHELDGLRGQLRLLNQSLNYDQKYINEFLQQQYETSRNIAKRLHEPLLNRMMAELLGSTSSRGVGLTPEIYKEQQKQLRLRQRKSLDLDPEKAPEFRRGSF